MALEGYLEDLGICDILQILSLSKKSGTLILKGPQGEGLVCFVDGQVVRASSSFFPENIGQLLLRVEIITEDQLVEALAWQKGLKSPQPLGPILTYKFQIAALEIEAVIVAQIEKIIFNFFSWTTGHFSFQLEEVKPFVHSSLNPLDFMLEHGLSSQRLVVKGQRVAELCCEDELDNDLIERELSEMETQQGQYGLDLLRGMLAELDHPELGGGIILLILRYASEIMDRAIIFDVRGNQLAGLGQFGLSGFDTSADDIVRKMRLPVASESLFAQVLKDKVVVRAALKNSLGEKRLKEFLQGVPEEVFLGPLVSDGEVVALLYGDNFPASQPFYAANAFEVFLSQAGLAMDQALHGTD
ncbi:MAG: hypothetical protein DRH06_04430 [Deltaproteobacteria bacterium]|nr:MAG: hypothetical protein DRH06_04430 [Deltaproteobacteria bacterium]